MADNVPRPEGVSPRTSGHLSAIMTSERSLTIL